MNVKNKPRLGSLGMIAVSTTAFIGTVVVPVVYFTTQNARSYDKLFSQIDSGQALIFTSVNDCSKKGITKDRCADSRNSAIDSIDHQQIYSLSYDSLDGCARHYGVQNCYEGSDLFDPIYSPKVVAWQAAANDEVDGPF